METLKHYQLDRNLDDKTLRQCLKEKGVDARRLSRFSQLALLGVLELDVAISPDTPIYLGSHFNSPSKFRKLFEQLMEQDLPSPLDFMANINNAATFAIANHFQITAPTLFLILEQNQQQQLFELAELDLKQRQTALIGWVVEGEYSNQQDQSRWWYVKA